MKTYFIYITISLILIVVVIVFTSLKNNDNKNDDKDDDYNSPCPENYVGPVKHPDACDKFIFCFGTQYVVMSCADGLYFDDTLNMCAPKNEVIC
ncbi:chtB [Psilogramma increta granulovirus]|uniref:ChtB n=1 Tax=Psilogramma increta granulovirus TaxID=2953508 RepID=A0A977TNY6_9BBAC|nr:chtB [Psilogramma increta granulovirus]